MKRLFALSVLPLLIACSNTPSITSYLTPYRIDVRQGNMVTQEMVAQLKPGLSKDQVRFILGTPLVTDMFHGDRWDYVYRFAPGRDEKDVQQRRLIVHFTDGKLIRLGGDVAADNAGAAEATAKPASRVIEIAPAADAVKQ
ncbi:MAG TPA: outer membrane protein assembly factor BamE [Rhodocyclaceae bacterium]|nr:outer membrane protein assembly factor BamE [Rhodocyclaceae bacterium]